MTVWGVARDCSVLLESTDKTIGPKCVFEPVKEALATIMAKQSQHIEKILSISFPGVHRALAAALGTADEATEGAVLEAVLERGDAGAFGEVVRRFDRLSPAHQKRVLGEVERFSSVLREAASEGGGGMETNAIEMIGRSGSSSLAYLLVGHLEGAESPHRRLASDSLLRMAKRVNFGKVAWDEAGRREYEQALSAVVEGCRTFHKHRRRDVLVAAMCFAPRRDVRLRRYLADHRSAASGVAGELMGYRDQPMACRALLWMAGEEGQGEAAARALGRESVVGMLGAVLGMGHLLVVPRVRAVVRGVGHVEHLVEAAGAVDAQVGRGMVGLVGALGMSDKRRAGTYGRLAEARDRLTRLRALRALMGMRCAEADEVVGAMCFDSEEGVARTALRWLIGRRWEGLNQLMVRLVGSDHAAVREMAEAHLAPLGFERMWSGWEQMSRDQRERVGTALMKIDRRFLAKLEARLSGGDAGDRMRAVQVVRALGQSSYFEGRLVGLTEDGDERVAATAVRALGEMSESPTATAALEKALEHGDDRVRSNAIEALEALEMIGLHGPALARISEQGGNRSRATAIRALMRMPVKEGVPALTRMLGDGDERHRLSALWVVEHMGLIGVLDRVAEIAKGDGDTKVRRRAIRVVQEMVKRAREAQREVG